MTAWQYFAGAGLVVACCPLQGHVDVPPGGARADLCVPARHEPAAPPTPTARPSVAAVVPGALPGPAGPTVRHPARPAPEPALHPSPAAVPRPATVAARPEPPPAAPAPAAPGPGPAPVARAAALPTAGFHVRPYRPVALQRRAAGGMSTMMLLVVVTTPAVLAAAVLRPRGRSGRSGTG
ncbi:hypothetical protein ACFWAR_01745 [Streptomyces sp. NPDC059917]|uniref:hypothetical protein n=1 Tax=Streptomyces sp. NPDC059917 TaxID=3347002 RepID=UPI003668677A